MTAVPRVSVVVPVHNRPAFVREALDSALSQECPGGLEVVVVDDGSTDDTPDVLRSYGTAIRAIRQENAGPSHARNRAIAESRAPFVALLDSDDVWLPGKLAAQLAVLEGTPDACLVHSDVAEFVEGAPAAEGTWTRRPEILGGRVLRALFRRNFVHTMTVVLRRAALPAGPAFDPAYPPCEDWDLWLRLAERAPFAADPVPRVRTRIHEGGISRDPIVVYGQGCRALDAAAARLTAAGHPDAAYARRETARWHVKLGKRLARAGRTDAARSAYRRAVELAPGARLDVLLARVFPKR